MQSKLIDIQFKPHNEDRPYRVAIKITEMPDNYLQIWDSISVVATLNVVDCLVRDIKIMPYATVFYRKNTPTFLSGDYYRSEIRHTLINMLVKIVSETITLEDCRNCVREWFREKSERYEKEQQIYNETIINFHKRW